MKKLSLNLLKAHLSRDEMRAVSGGSGDQSISGRAYCRCLDGSGREFYAPNCGTCVELCGTNYICVG